MTYCVKPYTWSLTSVLVISLSFTTARLLENGWWKSTRISEQSNGVPAEMKILYDNPNSRLWLDQQFSHILHTFSVTRERWGEHDNCCFKVFGRERQLGHLRCCKVRLWLLIRLQFKLTYGSLDSRPRELHVFSNLIENDQASTTSRLEKSRVTVRAHLSWSQGLLSRLWIVHTQ